MTSRNVAGWPAQRKPVHWTRLALRLAAALLLAPLAACAAPVGLEQAPASQQQAAPQAAPRGDAPAPLAAAPVPVPAPASQETQPLPRGATTTGRPATPARPAPSGPVSTPVQAPGPTPAQTAPAPAAEQAAAPVVTTPAPDQRPPQVMMPGSAAPATGGLLQTIMALVLVIGLLLALAWFMKRYGPRAMGASANIRLVGALNIGGRERIMVVEVGDQWIVVGASPGRVNALATLPRQEGVEAQATLAAHMPGARTAGAASFGDWLKKTIDNRNAK